MGKSTNKYSIMNLIQRLNKGESSEDLEKEILVHDKEVSKEKGKVFGACASCGLETALVEEVGLCGPCCFGEAETAYGNW